MLTSIKGNNYTELIEQGQDNMDLCSFLNYHGFDAEHFGIKLQFWFELNNRGNDEYFVLTDELVDLIGYRGSGENKRNQRTNLIRFIEKNFTEHLHYKAIPVTMSNTGKGGQRHKMEIWIKKRPFKQLLMSVGTETSRLIHEYMLDLEEGVTQYVVYQNQCKDHQIEDQKKMIRNCPMLMSDMDDMIDTDAVVEVRTIDEFHRHMNTCMYVTTKMEDLLFIAGSVGLPDPSQYSKESLIDLLLHY